VPLSPLVVIAWRRKQPWGQIPPPDNNSPYLILTRLHSTTQKEIQLNSATASNHLEPECSKAVRVLGVRSQIPSVVHPPSQLTKDPLEGLGPTLTLLTRRTTTPPPFPSPSTTPHHHQPNLEGYWTSHSGCTPHSEHTKPGKRRAGRQAGSPGSPVLQQYPKLDMILRLGWVCCQVIRPSRVSLPFSASACHMLRNIFVTTTSSSPPTTPRQGYSCLQSMVSLSA